MPQGGAQLLGLALAGAVAFDALSGGSDRGWAKPGAFALLGVGIVLYLLRARTPRP